MDVIPREVFCFGEYAKADERSTVGDKPLEMATATRKAKPAHGDLPPPPTWHPNDNTWRLQKT